MARVHGGVPCGVTRPASAQPRLSASTSAASEWVKGDALAGRLRSVSTNEQPERLSAEEVRRVATLCHVGVSDAEVEELRGEMAKLVAEISVLQAIDTSGIEPTGHAVEGVHTVMRDDEPVEPMSLGDVLSNAPRREGDYFRVRAVME